MDPRDSADRIEPTLAAEAIEPTDRIEPTEATDSIEPAEPSERTDPAEPIDRIDAFDPMLRNESCEPIDHREPWLSLMPGILALRTGPRQRRDSGTPDTALQRTDAQPAAAHSARSLATHARRGAGDQGVSCGPTGWPRARYMAHESTIEHFIACIKVLSLPVRRAGRPSGDHFRPGLHS